LAVAKFLEAHDKVAWVNYPDLESNKYHALQQKYLPKGSCGVISFGLKGGRKAAADMMVYVSYIAIKNTLAS
jgi:O-acetylhomoserine (thiol)-lyase